MTTTRKLVAAATLALSALALGACGSGSAKPAAPTTTTTCNTPFEYQGHPVGC